MISTYISHFSIEITTILLDTHSIDDISIGKMSAVEQNVRVEYKGRVAIITIDNPKKLGALSGDGYYLLAKYMREVATHDEVVITVLTGTGGYFSA